MFGCSRAAFFSLAEPQPCAADGDAQGDDLTEWQQIRGDCFNPRDEGNGILRPRVGARKPGVAPTSGEDTDVRRGRDIPLSRAEGEVHLCIRYYVS